MGDTQVLGTCCLLQVTTLLGQIPEVEQARPADPAKLQELQKNIQLQQEKVQKLEANTVHCQALCLPLTRLDAASLSCIVMASRHIAQPVVSAK